MKNISKKLLAIQEEIGTLKKGSVNPFYSSTYVEINSLLAAVTPILHKHKVLLSQPLTNVDGKTAIQTMLLDAESGEMLEGTTVVPEINDAQKMGGAITYYRRYGAISMLGLGSEDDDGNAVSPSAKPKKTPVKKPAAKAASKSPAAKRSPLF